MPISRVRLARPERFRVSLFDDHAGSTAIPLPSRRMWPGGIVVGAMFALFASVAVGQIASMRGHEIKTVFDLMFVLFQGFWVLGWSVGVVFLFLLTVLFLFYGETARITGRHLVHVPRLGPLKMPMEFDLAKIRNLRVATTGPDRASIRFDYGTGDHGLGSEMPLAEAEGRVRTIQRAIDALGATAPADTPARAEIPPRPMPPPAAPPPPAKAAEPEPALASLSTLALIGANLVPLAGVLLFGWDLGQIMTLFWAENAVVGFYGLLRLAVVAKWAALLYGPFFVGHFGGFMAGHFLFIYYLFIRGVSATGPEPGPLEVLRTVFLPLWPALLALFLSHGVSFVTNYLGRREHEGREAKDEMAEPYKRVVVLHLTIIFGGWAILLLGSPVPALALLIVLKTAIDLRAHRRQHQ